MFPGHPSSLSAVSLSRVGLSVTNNGHVILGFYPEYFIHEPAIMCLKISSGNRLTAKTSPKSH